MRKKPYWKTISPNISIGYRRNQGPGVWVVRFKSLAEEWTRRLKISDDLEQADGEVVLNFWQAIDAARAFVRKPDEAADSSRPATVADALDAYARDLEARGGRISNARLVRIHLPGTILTKPVVLLRPSELCGWRDALIAKGLARSSVNRIRNSLRAALTLAAKRDRRIVNRHVWQDDFAALQDAVVARNVILTDQEANAVIRAAYQRDRALGILCEVMAQTGARPSQLARLEVADLDVARARLMMPRSGKGHPNKRAKKMLERVPVPIPAGLAALLQQEARGRPRHVPLLRRSNGEPWGDEPANNYRRDFAAVVAGLQLDAHTTLYSLRHTAISRSLLRNVPVSVVADLADTSESEIRKHYAKTLAHHADEIARKGLLDTEPPPGGNVVSLAKA